jgi:hypothetical protein
MRERDTAWIDLADKSRPVVVLEVQPDLVRVAYGTTNEHEWPRAVVHPETRQGRAFPLQEVTYFYGANTIWEQPARLRPGKQTCAWELLLAIRKLVEDHDASLTPDPG